MRCVFEVMLESENAIPVARNQRPLESHRFHVFQRRVDQRIAEAASLQAQVSQVRFRRIRQAGESPVHS